MVAIVLLLATSLVFSHPINDENLNSFQRRTCGPTLANRINRVCELRGGHNTRTSADITLHSRVRRGITDECCHNICTDDHIISYCIISTIDETIVKKKSSSSSVISISSVLSPIVSPTIKASTSTVSSINGVNEKNSYSLVGTNLFWRNQYTTSAPDWLRSEDLVKSKFENVDSITSLTLNKLLSSGSVGTVPPEFKVKVLLPPVTRIIY